MIEFTVSREPVPLRKKLAALLSREVDLRTLLLRLLRVLSFRVLPGPLWLWVIGLYLLLRYVLGWGARLLP